MPGIISPHINLGLVDNPPAGNSNLILDSLGRLTLMRSDGSLEIISATVGGVFGTGADGATGSTGATGVAGATGPQGATGANGSGSGISLYEMSYDTFYSGLSSSSLTASYYKITDYQTVGYILGGTAGATYSSSVEPLIVYAASNSCWPNALSLTNTQDEIHYDPFPSNWTDDRSYSLDGTNMIDGFKGVIYKRTDTSKNISCSFDWRNSIIRRWGIDQTSIGLTSWGTGTWSRGDYVYDSNDVIYYCLETHGTDGGSGTGSFNPESYYATSSTPNYELVRTNTRYHWQRLFNKDLYLLPAWVDGTMSSSYSVALGTYPENLGGTRILELPIDSTNYQDFNVFGIHGTTSTVDEVYDFEMLISSDYSKSKYGSHVLTNRFETTRESGNIKVNGNNFTLYDYIPFYPISQLLSDNTKFHNNHFSDFSQTLVYADEHTTIANSYTLPRIGDNIISGSTTIFGSFQLSNVESSINTTVEDSLLIKGFSLLSTFRSCQALSVLRHTLQTHFQNVDNTSFESSNGDFFVNIESSIFGWTENNLLEINLSSIDQSKNSEIGLDFEDNIIGPYGIRDSVISSSVTSNYMYGMRECNIGSHMHSITFSSTLQLENVFIEADSLNTQNLSSATYVYGNYSTYIYKRPDGSTRLRYYDNLDALVITLPTA
jgi:hypothetical protein